MYGTNGGDGPDVFMELGRPKEAAIAANRDLTNFPFNPFVVFHTCSILGNYLAAAGQAEESNAVFKNALEDARRLRMTFWEAILLKEQGRTSY